MLKLLELLSTDTIELWRDIMSSSSPDSWPSLSVSKLKSSRI